MWQIVVFHTIFQAVKWCYYVNYISQPYIHTTLRQNLKTDTSRLNIHSRSQSYYLLHVGTHITLGLLFELRESEIKQTDN